MEETIEQKIKEIKKIFFDECCWNWIEVFVQSMTENEEHYIAKVVYVDTYAGKYRDIYFYAVDVTKKLAHANGKIIENISADASGKNIDEAISNLLQLVNDFIKADYNVSPEGL